MKKVFVFITLFSVSSACATLEYNWKKHTFYSTHSEAINQAHYNMCVNEVLGEALLSEDFALAKENNELEEFWLIVYGILKLLYGTPEADRVYKDVQSIAFNNRRTAKLIAQLKDSREHFESWDTEAE